MVVTATELKNNLGKYLDMASSQSILINKNGKPIAALVAPQTATTSPSERMTSLFGILPQNVSVEEARHIREEEKWELC